MSRQGLVRVLLLASLASFATSIAACAADGDADEELADDGASEQALSSCKLGPQCSTQQLLVARSYLNAPPPKVTRPDVIAIIPTTGEVVPRQFSRKTTGVLELPATGRLTLSGNKDGTAAIAIDDFLLVEVLGLDGRTLASGVASPAGTDVKLSGQSVGRVAEPTPWVGINQGFVYAAGAIDITRLVPRNTPFRLRTTAFDYAGVALTSEVHLKYDASVPTPVVENPWDAAFCTEAPMTDAQALARFAPGTTTATISMTPKVWMRTRSCNAVTGCTAWATSSTFPVEVRHSAFGYPDSTRYWWFSYPMFTMKLELHVGGRGSRFSNRLETSSRYGRMVLQGPFWEGAARGGNFDTTITSANNGQRVDQGDDVRDGFQGVIGNHCMKLVASRKELASSNEHEVVIFERY